MTTEFVGRSRPLRQYEADARAKAFAAAREHLAGVGNLGEMAQKHGADRTSVTIIAMILRFGSPEEIAAVETHKEAPFPAWKRIRPRIPKEARTRLTYKRSAEVEHVKDSDRQVFKMLKIAFDALSSMPSPPDVVAICRANRMRSAAVERKLLTLHTWLEAFFDAWTKK